MKTGLRAALIAIAAIRMLATATPADAQTIPNQQDTVVTTRAAGPFEVRMAPLETNAPIGRMSLDKTYHGDLQGTAIGEMMAAMGSVEGSAAYSAIEQVTGTLAGRSGTFMLQHTGVMNRGAQSLLITVVPDSGTGELAGLSGTMNIIIEGGKHAYTFDYTLPAQ
jgi:hypothetical protein